MDFDNLTFDVSEVVKDLVPKDRLAELVETFSQIDANKDGKIEIDEFINSALTEHKIRLTKMFKYADVDKDGCIEFEEYVAVKEPNFSILKQFRALDLDHNGLLSLEEALNIADKLDFPLSSDQVKSVIQDSDRDGDGQITYYEYLGAIAHIGFQ